MLQCRSLSNIMLPPALNRYWYWNLHLDLNGSRYGCQTRLITYNCYTLSIPKGNKTRLIWTRYGQWSGADLGLILTDFLTEGPREQASRGAPGNFFWFLKSLKFPFLGFLSNDRKLEKENIFPDYFPESSIIVILLLKMFILKNLTDFRKTVETGVDPRLMIDWLGMRKIFSKFFEFYLR